MTSSRLLARLGRGALYSLPLLFLALFYFYPLGSILWASFAPGGRFYCAGDTWSYWPGWQVGALDSAHYATDSIHRVAAGKG